MSVESEVYDRLDSSGAVNALVDDRVYADAAPQDAKYPYIVVQLISAPRESVMGADTGDVRARVQVTIFAKRRFKELSTDRVGNAVRVALQRYSGGGIQDIYFDNERSVYLSEIKIYQKIYDLIIPYKE